MLETNASACAAEQQQYNVSLVLLICGQSLVESLRRRLQCFHRVELRLHRVGLRMHAVDGRAYPFRGHLGLMRCLQALHISARCIFISLPRAGLIGGDAEQRLRISEPPLDHGVEI